MLRLFRLGWALVCGWQALGSERVFDFSTNKLGTTPAGFKAFVAGEGKPQPADWQVVLAKVPVQIAPESPKAAAANELPVLAQRSRDPTNERYPVLYFDGERYGDFTLTTRFCIVDGVVEQMAGVVFRLVDEKNFCVVRASALGGNVRFYKFVDGQRSTPVGIDISIKPGQWYELTVKGAGNKFDVLLDGRQVIPTLTDSSFPLGKVGFMTKSDAVSQFTDARVTFQPLVTVAEKLVKETLERQPRILNLRLYGRTTGRPELHVIAAKDAAELGLAATDTETRVLAANEVFYGEENRQILVTTPLRDRNGEAVGVVKFFLKPFPGQTEANAVARVLPTVRWMESQLAGAEGLTD